VNKSQKAKKSSELQKKWRKLFQDKLDDAKEAGFSKLEIFLSLFVLSLRGVSCPFVESALFLSFLIAQEKAAKKKAKAKAKNKAKAKAKPKGRPKGKAKAKQGATKRKRDEEEDEDDEDYDDDGDGEAQVEESEQAQVDCHTDGEQAQVRLKWIVTLQVVMESRLKLRTVSRLKWFATLQRSSSSRWKAK